jgi:GcrA cell cycle regulator
MRPDREETGFSHAETEKIHLSEADRALISLVEQLVASSADPVELVADLNIEMGRALRERANRSIWDDQRVGMLKELWLKGLTPTQIASELKDVSRHAVIGKAHHLKLSVNAASSQLSEPVSTALRSARTAPLPAERSDTALPAAVPRTEETRPVVYRETQPVAATVLTLGVHMCKWPIANPDTDGFTFCGRHAEGPYCDEHARVAYEPRQGRKKVGPNELARTLRRYI